MENPIKMDDLGVPLFLETPICSLGLNKIPWFLQQDFLHIVRLRLDCAAEAKLNEAMLLFMGAILNRRYVKKLMDNPQQWW